MKDRNEMRALAVISEIGFGIAGPMVICTGLGFYLDGLWGTKPWLVLVGLGIGLVSMFATFYRLATAFPAGKPGKPAAKTDGTGPGTVDGDEYDNFDGE
ncbi:MAG: AtpZ/AtpI family protein [Chloroflexia bacterium]